MRKFFLNGDYLLNAGPSNVNRSLIESSDGSMVYIEQTNRLAKRIERLIKCAIYPVVAFSAGVNKWDLWICKTLKKRIVYIMHGCIKYENSINHLGVSEKNLIAEQKILNAATKIVAVSENYAEWVKMTFPQYADKVTFVNNGLAIRESFFFHNTNLNNTKYIALTGGNRPQKANLEVCKAVEKLNSEGLNIKILIFGRFHSNGEPILEYPFVEKMGQMDKEQYYKKLEYVDLFIVNSELESFGLVIGDAMNCGCSLLMSKMVGAISIFKNLQDSDIIVNNHDIKELSAKIVYLLNNSNAKRLFESIDREKCSYKEAFINFKRICLNEK